MRPDEEFEEGVRREAVEELGVDIELELFLVSSEARFTAGERVIDWHTHVFSARTEEERLDPVDTHEISGARWGTRSELTGPLREAMLRTGRALWRYRVALHDASLDQLEQLG